MKLNNFRPKLNFQQNSGSVLEELIKTFFKKFFNSFYVKQNYSQLIIIENTYEIRILPRKGIKHNWMK